MFYTTNAGGTNELFMDSTQSIATLQALRNTLAAQVVGIQGQVDALDVAFTLLKDGYQTDQARIDTEVQKAQEAVTAQVADLTDQLTAKDAAIVDLQSQVDIVKATIAVSKQVDAPSLKADAIIQ